MSEFLGNKTVIKFDVAPDSFCIPVDHIYA